MASYSYLNLIYLFYSCTNLASITGLGNLSGVRQMRYTFSSCSMITLDFRSFDPSALLLLLGLLVAHDDPRGSHVGAAFERYLGFAMLLLVQQACGQQ